MLFMHEVHAVVGEREHEFEAAYREGWMPLLAGGDDARLLWYLNQAHGGGPAYTVVTITAVRDGAAYLRLAEGLRGGALHDWARAVDALRHRVDGRMLVPVEWSPLQDVDLAAVPVDGTEHDLTLYMEDTGWPTAALDDYIEFWDAEYFRMMEERSIKHPVLINHEPIIDVKASVQDRPVHMSKVRVFPFGTQASPRHLAD